MIIVINLAEANPWLFDKRITGGFFKSSNYGKMETGILAQRRPKPLNSYELVYFHSLLYLMGWYVMLRQ